MCIYYFNFFWTTFAVKASQALVLPGIRNSVSSYNMCSATFVWFSVPVCVLAHEA